MGDISIFLSRGKSPKYSEKKKYPVFAQKCNLKSGGISLDSAKFLDESTLPKWGDEYKLKDNDILVNSTGTGTVGRVGMFSKEILGDYPFIVPDSHISVVRLSSKMNSYYIYEVMNSMIIQQYIEDNLAGSTNQKELYIGILQKSLIPLPPLAEQQRIVEKIEELIPHIEHYGKAQTELDLLNRNIKEQLKKSVLQYAIEGKLVPQDETEGTAEELLLQIQAEKQKLYEENKLKKKDLEHSTIFKGEDNKYYEKIGKNVICIDEEIPFEIPKDWRWVRFGQIVKLSMGKTPPRDDSRYWLNAKRNWVSISDMTNYGRIKTTKEQISEEAANSLMRECSPINTLLMSFKLTVGRTAILDIEAYHNEAIVSIYPYIDKKFMLRNYLFYTLPILANIGDSKDAIKGKTLNSKSLNNLLIPFPPLAEQQRIVESIDAIFRCIEN